MAKSTPLPRSKSLIRANSTKRIFDLSVILIFSPLVLFLGGVAAITVGIGIGRPVLFRQARIGLDERQFDVLKFRSMTDERDSTGELLPDSQRLTRLGAFIRRTSLDELPQLMNVIRGDMSLIGPRPLFVRYLPFYSPVETSRHMVRPGITGLAQTEGRNSLNWDDRLKLDVEYVESMTILSDLRILWRTAQQALGQRGVVVIASESGEPLDTLRSYPVTDTYGLRGFVRSDIPSRVAWMNHPSTREHMKLPENISEASTLSWYRQIRASNQRHDFVVYETKTGVPRAMLGLTPTPSHSFPELYIFVDPTHSGHGAGKASLKLVFEWLRATGVYPGCSLFVNEDNVRAVNLYIGFGFKKEGFSSPGRRIMSLAVSEWISRA